MLKLKPSPLFQFKTVSSPGTLNGKNLVWSYIKLMLCFSPILPPEGQRKTLRGLHVYKGAHHLKAFSGLKINFRLHKQGVVKSGWMDYMKDIWRVGKERDFASGRDLELFFELKLQFRGLKFATLSPLNVCLTLFVWTLFLFFLPSVFFQLFSFSKLGYPSPSPPHIFSF